MHLSRIAATEKQREAEMKETLARKERRIEAIRHKRDKMIAQVSSSEGIFLHSLIIISS